ncbi:MAG: 30S ribosomal protein S20 [bacterium]|nr:30S ribosomal protein S20 [bacterium]
MPIIKSAKKRVRTAHKGAIRNSKTRRSLRDSIKTFDASLEKGVEKDVNTALREAYSAIDTAVKKNVIHKNNAARKKAKLSSLMKANKIKLTASTAKKAEAKKPAPKKTAAKKPAAKKAPTKK